MKVFYFLIGILISGCVFGLELQKGEFDEIRPSMIVADFIAKIEILSLDRTRNKFDVRDIYKEVPIKYKILEIYSGDHKLPIDFKVPIGVLPSRDYKKSMATIRDEQYDLLVSKSVEIRAEMSELEKQRDNKTMEKELYVKKIESLKSSLGASQLPKKYAQENQPYDKEFFILPHREYLVFLDKIEYIYRPFQGSGFRSVFVFSESREIFVKEYLRSDTRIKNSKLLDKFRRNGSVTGGDRD